MSIFSKIPGTLTTTITGITPEEIEWANSIGVKYGGVGTAGGVGNKGDAARHVALGYLAAVADERRGYAGEWTKNLVQLKEYAQQTGTRRNIDSNMDRHNNAIGFELQGIAGDNLKDFEDLLDNAMQNTVQVQSVNDMPFSDYRNLKPVYIQEGYRLYKGGASADPSKGN